MCAFQNLSLLNKQLRGCNSHTASSTQGNSLFTVCSKDTYLSHPHFICRQAISPQKSTETFKPYVETSYVETFYWGGWWDGQKSKDPGLILHLIGISRPSLLDFFLNQTASLQQKNTCCPEAQPLCSNSLILHNITKSHVKGLIYYLLEFTLKYRST